MLDPWDWYFPQFLTVHCIKCKCMLKIWHSIIFAANYYIIRHFFRQFLECWFNIFKKHNAYDFHDYHWIIWEQITNLTTSLLNNFMQEPIQNKYCVQNHDNAITLVVIGTDCIGSCNPTTIRSQPWWPSITSRLKLIWNN
jgi:hypothetical protein